MAIASKHKKRTTVSHNKRHGLHQKRSSHFLKTYWPYLPMASIVVFALAINFYLTAATSANSAATDLVGPAYQKVTRIGLLTNDYSKTLTYSVTAIATLALVLFIWSHSKQLRRVFMKGEEFVLSHVVVDLVLLIVTMVGFVLTRNAGIIR